MLILKVLKNVNLIIS